MKSLSLCGLMAGTLIAVSGVTAYAADDQPNQDENTIVGACMVQKLTQHAPPVDQSTIEKCSGVDATAAPKCLGVTDDEYLTYAKFCVAQLVNARCVSAKMKVSLMQYASCGYEKDPVACYKALGFTADAVTKFSTDCQKASGT